MHLVPWFDIWQNKEIQYYLNQGFIWICQRSRPFDSLLSIANIDIDINIDQMDSFILGPL